jgi:hypothetical protein
MKTTSPPPGERFSSFGEFYPFYLSEHTHRVSRRLHFFGSLGGLWCLLQSVSDAQPLWLLAGLIWGYSLAWVGHFAFEKNKPASFKQPFYSFLGDWVMFKDMLTGKIPF